MTEVSIEPVAVDTATTPSPRPPAPPAPSPAAAEVDHTPGGWPVVPLALSGANTTVGMVAAASLAGGPIAAAVAATGAVVLSVAAATRNRKADPRREARKTAARAAGRSAAARAAGRGAGARAGRSASGAGRPSGQSRPGSARTPRPGTAGAKAGRTAAGSPKNPHRPHGGTVLGAKAAGRAGQVRALRAAQKTAGGSRADRRAQTTAARRAVADTRRTPNTRPNKHGSSARRSAAGRLLGTAAGKTRAVQKAAIAKHRAKRDAKTAGQVAAQRAAVRKAPARRAARKALRRSAARFQGRRLLASLLALPLGLLGLISTPIGRKFDIPWLMYPGRRLFWAMVRPAAQQRAERDADIRAELAKAEAAADAQAAKDGAEGVADHVKRPAGRVPTSTNTDVSEGEHVSGFRFEEAAAEMEQAANAYDPDHAMEILAMVEGLPAALTSVANVMKILAERSDSEFPLEKEVADGFNDIFGALMSAVAVAEDMGPLFRQAHEQDIARHEDPRNGTEAEKGWNV
ncbi:hypothetical protein [Streptomyces sp. 3214.6]|uniref:hypothetical protein n=1 Tax=Streptomyces sp. 3214.6 TaxID=1882757 RepID=UPI00090A65BA|nr:hypothetical protein [Streptomyces sp. 3214.6]SHI06672.1 hypothetical protein SAMN05444521_3639 [Streptomyces sp. 3214.6]